MVDFLLFLSIFLVGALAGTLFTQHQANKIARRVIDELFDKYEQDNK